MSGTRLGNVPVAALVLAALGPLGCTAPGRAGLPSPFPLTQGATPLPSNGIGAGLEFGQGLRRPEPERADLLTFFIGGGLANRVSASWATYEGRTPDDVRGDLWRIKFRLGPAFGPGTGLQIGYARMDRSLYGGQHDRLRSVDFAGPTEFVLTHGRSKVQLRAIFGPRLTVERYTDLNDASRSTHKLHIGVLGGTQVSVGRVHLFAEATFTRMPEAPGQSWSSGLVVLPTVGVMVLGGASQPRGTVP
jgi:hypothetical protein